MTFLLAAAFLLGLVSVIEGASLFSYEAPGMRQARTFVHVYRANRDSLDLVLGASLASAALFMALSG